MSVAYLQKRVEERAGLADLSTSVLDKCAADNRDPSAEERQQLDGWSTKIKSLDTEIAQLETQFRGNQRFEDLVGRIGAGDEASERRKARDRDKPEPEQRKSIGQQFIESDGFKAYSGRGSMAPFEIEAPEERAATVIDGTITTGDLNIDAYQWSGPVQRPYRSPVLDAVGYERVTSGAVEYETWGLAPEAALVPEGELKPEAVFSWEPHTDSLDTFAHWKGITRQALDDKPRIRSIVENLLRTGVTKKISSAAGAALLGGSFRSIDDADNPLAGIRHALAIVEEDGYAANAVMLNPQDFADLDIAAAGAANSGPTAFGNFWGLRPVPVAGIPRGTQFVGSFREGITWFDRAVTSVYVTDSHADYFIRNKLVILAEARGLIAVTDEAAIVKVTAPPADGGEEAARSTKSSK